MAKTKGFGDPKGDIDVAHDTTEQLVAGTPGVDGHVNKGVDALALGSVKVTGHGKSVNVVLGVEEVARRVLGSGDALVVVIDDKVLALVGERRPAVRKRVAGVPCDGEASTLLTLKDLVRSGADILGNRVGGETRVLIGADRLALGAVRLLSLEELGVGRTEDVETVAVVGRHNNEGLIELTDLFEVLKSGAESVVELKEVAEGAVNVLDVHLLVDKSSLRHERPSSAALLGASGENVNGLDGHVLETRLVVGADSSVGLNSKVESVAVNVLVKPSGDVAASEDGESTVLVVECVKLGLVVANLVTSLGPALKLRDIAVGGRGKEVFGTATKEKVDTLPGVPRVVAGDTNEVLLDDGIVLPALRGVCCQLKSRPSLPKWGSLYKESEYSRAQTAAGVASAMYALETTPT